MPNPRWRRKKGIERKTGYRRLERWSPKRARNFALTRLDDIAALIDEIEMVYEDVDMFVIYQCQDLRALLPGFREVVGESHDAGISL